MEYSFERNNLFYLGCELWIGSDLLIFCDFFHDGVVPFVYHAETDKNGDEARHEAEHATDGAHDV